MDRLNLNATNRAILGKKVKLLRKKGLIPGHIFGKGLDSKHVSVNTKDFIKTFAAAGETGLIDLKVEGSVKPVMVRGAQYDPVNDQILHVDFYQVNLKEKVIVPVPIVLVGEEPESVHLGEAIVLQTLNEVSVEALPLDLIEKIEVDVSSLKNIDDAISVVELKVDREKLVILADNEAVVVKLAPAVTAEMEQLLEEQAAETAAAAEEVVVEEGTEGEKKDGEPTSTEAQAGGEVTGGESEPGIKESSEAPNEKTN